MLRSFTSAEIEAVARAIVERLSVAGPQAYSDLILAVPGYDRKLAHALRRLVARGRIVRRPDGRYQGPDHGQPPVHPSCSYCGGSTLTLTPQGRALLRRLEGLAAGRPAVAPEHHQRPVTLLTALRRALYAYRRGDVVGRRVVCLGDDDLSCLALALVGGAREIAVLDIDPALLDFLDLRLGALGSTPYRLEVYDCRRPLPPGWSGCFQTVLTDPSSGLLRLFLRRALELLEEDPGRTLYTFCYSQAKTPSLEFQRMVTRWNLLITDLLPAFNRYQALPPLLPPEDRAWCESRTSGEDLVSFVESLVRLVTLGPRPRRKHVLQQAAASPTGSRRKRLP